MTLEKFDYNNMPFLVDRVIDLWTPEQAQEDFRRIYAEAIIRQDMHENDMQFQLSENGKIMALACASKKNEENSGGPWWYKQYSRMSDSDKAVFSLNRDYLSLMDKKTFAFMTDDDVKLNLFISLKKGWGKKILDEAMEKFRQSGFKNMFLWTDEECNVDWYINHNYELLDEGSYEPFSFEKDYKTYIFKMKLQ